MPRTLSNDDLTRPYTWVDEIDLSRPERSIARDFSDGVLVAEASNDPNQLTIGNRRRNTIRRCIYCSRVYTRVDR
ncbi:unnamed protein product, partial [Ascophyllum nodosum]